MHQFSPYNSQGRTILIRISLFVTFYAILVRVIRYCEASYNEEIGKSCFDNLQLRQIKQKLTTFVNPSRPQHSIATTYFRKRRQRTFDQIQSDHSEYDLCSLYRYNHNRSIPIQHSVVPRRKIEGVANVN